MRDKTRANFCDYFKPQPGHPWPAALASFPSAKPNPGAFQAPAAGRTAAAKARVDDLFGGAPDASSNGAREGLDALFGGKGEKK